MSVVNRISGMSSGLDTDSLVKAMTMNQQSKIDALFRKKTTMEWKSNAITDMNNVLRTFKDDFLSVLGSKSLMRTESYNTFSVKNTNNAVSISAGVGARLGMHSITVNNIASGAKATGSEISKQKLIMNASLRAIFEADVRETGGDWDQIEKNGEMEEGFNFTINNVNFSFSADTRLSDVMSAVNNSKAGVKLSYSELTRSFSIESTATGAKSKIDISDESSNFFAFLGLADSSGKIDIVDGVNARVQFGEDPNVYEYDSNNFTIDGITYTLNGPTTEPIQFVVERNSSSSVDLVKSFVESLNEMLSKINTELRQRRDTKFSPLTDMLKEAMTEKEIEDWEGKAKQGLLYRDRRLDAMMNSIQRALGSASGMRDIGISMGSYVPGAAPKLEIDEDKLRRALEADPERVHNIMARAARPGENDEGGVLVRINAAIDKYTSDTRAHDIQNLRENVNDYVKRINAQEDKLYIMQERLYLKYASFEKSLGAMQTQSSKITAYFGM